MSSDFENSDSEEVLSNDLIEPQVILQNEAEENCPLCQESLSNHYQGQPCGSFEVQTGHFLFEESTSSTSNPTPKCVVCQARQPSREHLANHFMNELIEELEDDENCDKCHFQVKSGDAKSLVLHDVTEHNGDALDRLLQDASLVSSKRAEVEARGHRQSLGKFNLGLNLKTNKNCTARMKIFSKQQENQDIENQLKKYLIFDASFQPHFVPFVIRISTSHMDVIT